MGRALMKYKGPDTIVLAIPRGGVEVGYQVARERLAVWQDQQNRRE